MITPAEYRDFARMHLGNALADLDDADAFESVELALMALARYAGSTAVITLDPADVDEIVSPPVPGCTCPPGLPERGGFSSGCAAHA